MNGMEYILANLWIGLIAFFLLAYAISDGADLGLGMLALFCRDEEERGLMIGAIESTWHTNQTWLVIVGGMVFGAFPMFYAIVFSALYIPAMAMIFALIFRGLAIDYYGHAENKRLAGWIFALGSLLVAVTQGFAVGGLLGGIAVTDGRFAGSVWDWLTPFTGLVTVGVIFGYVMLGASFLILKAEDSLQARGYRYAWISAACLLPVSCGVYLWLMAKYPHMIDKFTRTPDAYWIVPFPVIAATAAAFYLFSLWKRYEVMPIFLNAAIILFSFAGVSLALYPHLIPEVITSAEGITGTAASYSTLVFMTIVTGVLVPVILLYNTYNQFWVFRGKIRDYIQDVEAAEE